MISDYSIELETENIYNEKTKEYFKEVLSSYIIGNYRSSIVVLWTVTIYDLMLKLEELSTLYEDSNAKRILEEIESNQKANPKSPEWESKLLLRIEESMDIFQTHEIVHIENLKNLRHISAHPTIDNHTLNLYQPNKETVRALIRNILEIVLTRPPLASKKIFLNFLIDLASKKDLLTTEEKVEKYLDATYFKRTPMIVKEYIFKELWKLTFNDESEKASENRSINFSTLKVLFKNYNTELMKLLKSDLKFYTKKINFSLTVITLDFLLVFLGKFIHVFKVFPFEFQELIKAAIKNEYKYKIIAFFLYDREEDYINFFLTNYEVNTLVKDSNRNEYIVRNLDKKNANKVIEKFIDSFISSRSYNDADVKFSNLIAPIIKYLDETMMKKLLNGILSNSQTSDRSQSTEDNKLLEKRCIELNMTYTL